MKLELCINTRIYSKKNSRRFIKRGGRFFLVPSIAYSRSRSDIMAQIFEQLKRIPNEPIFSRAMSVHTEFYIPGNLKVDADNLHTSILDILQESKVIDDDKYILEGSYEKHPGADAWKCEIVIKSL